MTIDNQMWLFNPVSEFWYSLRYEKDIFSTLVQGTGSYVFDLWVGYLRAYGIKICMQFHDEKVSKHKEGNREHIDNIHMLAIKDTNDTLKLNREIKIDIQWGKRYSEIH